MVENEERMIVYLVRDRTGDNIDSIYISMKGAQTARMISYKSLFKRTAYVSGKSPLNITVYANWTRNCTKEA